MFLSHQKKIFYTIGTCVTAPLLTWRHDLHYQLCHQKVIMTNYTKKKNNNNLLVKVKRVVQ